MTREIRLSIGITINSRTGHLFDPRFGRYATPDQSHDTPDAPKPSTNAGQSQPTLTFIPT
ncbi:hypothetical protein [Desulfoluna sp.]|uniref:hypothetical protein n=1 Tax=Desulfoluna sp. TaxID=2045199 RepID=UPI0026198D24|nr:hypothetical protein [Desulfoluna sp.]